MDTLLKTGMRVIPALISFIMLILFLLPMTAGIINLGNCVGALTSAALTAVFLFWDRFTGVVSHMWERPAGKVIISAFSAAAVVFTLVAVTVSFFMLREMNDRPRDTDTTVVVLGCKVKNEAPSLMLGRRLNAAYEYLSAEPDVKVIVSGGKGDDESISEAQCMRDYLVDRGISPERIYMEDKSTDTDENLRFSQDIIRREGLPEHITIVTDGFHQLRSDMKAEALGMKAYNISAHTPLWLVPTYWVREWFGIVYYIIR